MAVTDVTEGLPWWAQGPGATGGPGSTPQGSGGAPGGSSTAWLQYLQQMYGIDPQQAMAMLTQGGADGGNPQAGPVSADPRLGSSVTMNAPPGPGGSGAPMPARPATGMGQPAPVGNYAQTVGNHGMWPTPPVGMNSGGPAPAAAAPSASNPLASSGGATGNGATSNPRFIRIDAPNASPQNSMRNAPQGTALNLAGLFGRGAANPANVPAANAQPVSGPLAPGGIANAPMPPVMPPDIYKRRTMLPNY